MLRATPHDPPTDYTTDDPDISKQLLPREDKWCAPYGEWEAKTFAVCDSSALAEPSNEFLLVQYWVGLILLLGIKLVLL